MAVDQVLVGASPGDAVTRHALEIRRQLREHTESEIYSLYIDEKIQGDVRELSAMRSDRSNSPDDVLLFHASIGDQEMEAFLLSRNETLALIYHNISPPQSFDEFDPRFAGLLRQGFELLTTIRPRVSAAFAVSEFNANDLRALGYENIERIPLVVDFSHLIDLEPEAATQNHLDQQVGPLIISVGQLLPHKRPDLLLQAFHVLVTYLEPTARLAMIGPSRLDHYTNSLTHLTHELNLSSAWITGGISDAELVSFYRHGDVFVSTSSHEGFGAPPLEAMAFDVPTVVCANGALEETTDGASLLLPGDAGPELIAEAMYAVISSSTIADDLRARGKTRVAALAHQQEALAATVQKFIAMQNAVGSLS